MHVCDVREFVRRIAGLHSFLDGGPVEAARRLVVASSVSEAREMVYGWIRDLKEGLSDVERNQQVSVWMRRDLEKTLLRRIENARICLEGLERLELSLSGRSVKCSVYGSATIPVLLENKVPLACAVSLEAATRGDVLVELSRSSLRLEPYGVSEVDVRVIPRKRGDHAVVLKARARWLDSEREFAGSFTVEAVSEPAELRVRPRVVGEAFEGEEVLVEVEVENAGGAGARAVIKNPFGGEERVDVNPGEKKTLLLRGKLGLGRHVLTIEGDYRDELGNVSRLPVHHLEVEVKPKRGEKPRILAPEPSERPPETAAVERAKTAVPTVDVGSLLDVVGRHALSFLAGTLAGRLVPERRKLEKPVYVLDVPYVKSEGATVILEDPGGVVVEDRGSFLLVRRATLPEMLSSVDRDTARNLVGNFRALSDAALTSWRPPLMEEVELVAKEYRNLTEKRLGDLVEEVRRRGQKVEREEVERILPTNFVAEYSFGSRGLVRVKPKLKVYVGAYARLEELYFHGTDHNPLNLEEALRGLELEEEFRRAGGYGRIFILASPTGWSPAVVDQAKRVRGATQLVLVDLKRGEAFYNELDDVVRSLVEHLGLARQPELALKTPLQERLEELDTALLSGNIDEATYRARLRELLGAAL